MKKLICMLLLISLLLTVVGCNSGYRPTISKFELPQLKEERMTQIQESWKNRAHDFGFPEGIDFCDLASGKDGIRYYGSYEAEYAGDMVTYDILYIPCETLQVASQFSAADYSFLSHSAFCLYIFKSEYWETSDYYLNTYYPLALFFNAETGVTSIPEEALAKAEELHRAYEYWIHGSVLTEMPKISSKKEQMRVQAVWLLRSGGVADFETGFQSDYWGNFGGYDVFFDEGIAQAETTIRIGEVEFTHGCAFTLIVHKDGKFCTLQSAYEKGLISAETVMEIKQSRQKP